MPTVYDRDDERRLITLTVTEPFSVDDVIRAIERQMDENTWAYAMLYDMRATARLSSTLEETRLITNRVHSLGGDRARGPVALAISGRPEQVRAGVEFASSGRGVAIPEVLFTALQLYDWIARHAPRRDTENL